MSEIYEKKMVEQSTIVGFSCDGCGKVFKDRGGNVERYPLVEAEKREDGLFAERYFCLDCIADNLSDYKLNDYINMGVGTLKKILERRSE